MAATTFAYDGLDRVVRELLPDGSRTERIYGPWQVLEEVHEASSGLRERRMQRFDGLGRLAAVDEWEHPTSPAPFTTSYLYDPFSQLAVVRDPAANDPTLCNGHTASPACAGQAHEQRLFYDQVGNRIRLEDPDGGISAWSYDGAGLVAQQWRGNGQSHVFTYDALGRMQRIHPVNPPTPEAAGSLGTVVDLSRVRHREAVDSGDRSGPRRRHSRERTSYTLGPRPRRAPQTE